MKAGVAQRLPIHCFHARRYAAQPCARFVYILCSMFIVTYRDMQPETKEQGQRIRQGTEVFEPKKVGPKA